jgi:hypothetical protein
MLGQNPKQEKGGLNCKQYFIFLEACIGFWWGNLRERDHWENPGVNGKIIIRWIFKNWDVGVWTGLSWLRIGRWRVLVDAIMNLRVP